MSASCELMAPRSTPRSPHPRSSPTAVSSSGTRLSSVVADSNASGSSNSPRSPKAQHHRKPSGASSHNPKRSPSPNYFALSVNTRDTSASTSSAAFRPRQHWSPVSSAVRSTAALSPSVVPLDQNPEFAAFRRQSEDNAQRLASISAPLASAWLPTSPRTSRAESITNNGRRISSAAAVAGFTKERPAAPIDIPSPTTSSRIGFTSEVGRSPKRAHSSDPHNPFDQQRRDSPAPFRDASPPTLLLPNNKRRSPDAPPRLSLPGGPIGMPGSTPKPAARAETLPSAKDREDGPTMVSPQHVVNLLESAPEDLLVLDLRVSAHYTRSRIRGALNLCIPTTLLKRSSYNLQRLAAGLSDEDQRTRLERWRHCSYIIVYDASASLLKDAQTCLSMLKKFSSEGWTGPSYIIRGGFTEFSHNFPAFVEHPALTTPSSSPSGARLAGTSGLSLKGAPPRGSAQALAPVIGGCEMPASKTAANPFFGNIRQNMDLIGGVGQMPVKIPHALSRQAFSELPKWIRTACDEADKGKHVSELFLQIEKKEQRRMQHALSGEVVYSPSSATATSASDEPNGTRDWQPTSPRGGSNQVQIAGIEKGQKNRYNNIWPYAHSAVTLQDVLPGQCDYINASFLQARGAAKRYIGTQAPIPATFVDFWNMTWQQNVRVIVMLTAENEGGQLKAHKYWPDADKPHARHGPLHLTFLSEHRASLEPSRIHRHRDQRPAAARRQTNPAISSVHHKRDPPPAPLAEPTSADQPYVTVRRFTISHDSQPFERMRQITQLQYTAWPDFGAPAQPSHLLGLIEQTDAVVRSTHSHLSSYETPPTPGGDSESRPMIVHCSAGCGRTGTFCTVDTVIEMLKRQRQHQLFKERSTGVAAPSKPASRKEAHQRRRSINSSPVSPRSERRNSRHGTPMDWIPSPSTADMKNLNRNPIDEVVVTAASPADSVAGPNVLSSKEEDGKSWLYRDDVDLIAQVVADMRRQRLSTVQSLRQFVLCYETVLEWLVEQKPRTA